jgi:tartrate-resistant acid phosphatase type 5
MRRLALIPACALLCFSLACADDGAAEGDRDNSTSAEGDGDPTTGDGDPTTGDGDPSTGDGDPTTGDGDPATGDGDPSTGDGDPATGDGDPTTGDGDPTTGDGDPIIGDPDGFVRFIAMGDGGEGNAGQYNVAAAIEQVCADKGGCEFVLYLGDNFYNDGVSSVDDDQFQTKFELPYADLTMPFWVAMGNHDYGELSFIWEKLEYEVEYTNYSDKWIMLDKWYSIVDQYPNLDIFVMDTTRLMWNHETSAQRNWLNGEVAASNAPWKIAIGHHPYYSNGAHGNAGNYEGLPWPPQAAGTTVKQVMDESLCGKVDLYLCGHDHNRQWPVGTCGNAEKTTHFIVSGAASKRTNFKHHGGGNEVYWEDDTQPGFLLLELTLNEIYGAFYDQHGVLEFEHTITK